ncbi:endo-1,4-beta-xylanase [Terriglobus sp.]|uniref:endo-1,4-beta-xylanase n=1 Tax=Terriglobus sp. TaxID=1889013 RepID=UPI003AFFD58A
MSEPRSLKAQAAAHHLLVGFALNVQQLRESEAYRRLVAEQSSIAVAENAMKWSSLRPTPDQYFFEDADFLLQFTETNRIKLRGHNLCWHEQLPKWFGPTATAANARSLLTEHIRTVAGRYAGRIHSWDVVNEAVEPKDGRPDGLRDSPWLKLIGESYLEVAFRTARQADPTALLTYNDYDIEGETEYDAAKRSAVLLLLRRLKQRNVPIDAVGIQSHISAGGQHRYGTSLQQFIRSCREMDLEVFVTEMDVDDRELPRDVLQRDAGVAQTYRSYLDTVLREQNVRAVLAWGVDDAHSWLQAKRPRNDGAPHRPLLFDEKLRPKPAFAAVIGSFAAARPLPAPSAGQALRGSKR